MKSSGACVIAGYVAVLACGGCGVGGGTLAGSGGANGGSAGSIPTGSGGAAGQCLDIARPAAKLALDAIIVLDTSASMNDAIDASCTTGCTSKWAASTQAINAVVEATAADIHWSLTFIGSAANACAPSIGAVSGPSSVREALDSRTSIGGNLIGPGNRATRAAIDLAAKSVSLEAGPAARAVLLLSDGAPECMAGAADVHAEDTASAVSAISDAFAMNVATFVVGLATSGGPADEALTEMANAGGFARAASPPYYPASSSAELATAMNALASSAACTFAIPPPMLDDGSSSRESISVSNDNGTIPQDPANGWTYTDWSHTALRLHGSSCDAVRNGSSAVYVLLYCHPGLA
jgi:hypothetical protein